ncbi:Crp/Fnr family transcriptional regulator [Halomonas koreensis]|uniref:Crp/Fnr family transcriptional regulator n=1 Tax=Halomonas koreensis TaxID=245385 RepID=A0ABU1G1Q3_9GAMM|nr:Crp/Fnr family transcriptional regulator [Halomonas koreensis]MDR5866814.1 Crp/Fnr family transcriptional regulator [Halomonas koreensis]
MPTATAPSPSSSTEPLLRPRRLVELVRGVPWLQGLGDPAVAQLLDAARVQRLGSREWLFHQEAPAQWLYIVISGVVRLVRAVGDGQQATIRCVERGGPLGELSMVSGEGRYLYSAETLRRTQLLALPAARCRELLDAEPACRAEFMSRMALELTERLEDLARSTQADAMARLVSYLLRQLPPGRAGEPRVVRLTIPKRWLAAQLAMTPETLSRLLARLREAGVIEVERHRLVVRDERELRAYLFADD